MNKSKYAKIAFCVIILTIGIRYGWTQAQPAKFESEPNSTLDVDRDNPFAGFLINKKSTARKFPQNSQLDEKPPEVFLETVTLKFLDAQNLEKAIAGMSSKYGSIATNPKNNSLIICDTKDNLDKILVEIKKADKPPQQLMIEAVIVDVQLDNDTEIGINWDILSDKMYDVSYRQNLGSRLSMVAATPDTKADTTAFNTTSAAGVEGDILLLLVVQSEILFICFSKKGMLKSLPARE